MRTRTTIALLLIAAIYVSDVQAEIYRCTSDDGNMVFSQVPCAKEPEEAKEEKAAEESEATEADEATPADIDVDGTMHVGDSGAVAQCKKPYRDAIDAIEARMLNGYTPDQGEAYKKQLLGLTKGLRRCES
jgi:hypothetical protein